MSSNSSTILFLDHDIEQDYQTNQDSSYLTLGAATQTSVQFIEGPSSI